MKPNLDMSKLKPDGRLLRERSLEENAAFLRYVLGNAGAIGAVVSLDECRSLWTADALRWRSRDSRYAELTCGCGFEFTMLGPWEDGVHLRRCRCGQIYQATLIQGD